MQPCPCEMCPCTDVALYWMGGVSLVLGALAAIAICVTFLTRD